MLGQESRFYLWFHSTGDVNVVFNGFKRFPMVVRILGQYSNNIYRIYLIYSINSNKIIPGKSKSVWTLHSVHRLIQNMFQSQTLCACPLCSEEIELIPPAWPRGPL